MTTLLVVTCDEHVNSGVGLCVQPVQQDAGGTFYPSKTQRAVAQAWGKFWDAVEAAAQSEDARIWWVNNGDAVDLNKHDQVDAITANRARIMDLALATYKRPAELSSRRFIVRGSVNLRNCWAASCRPRNARTTAAGRGITSRWRWRACWLTSSTTRAGAVACPGRATLPLHARLWKCTWSTQIEVNVCPIWQFVDTFTMRQIAG